MIALTYLVVPVLRSWRDVLLALGLPAGVYALHPLSFETITLWSHHTLGFAISILVLVCLLMVVRAKPSKPRLRHFQAIALAASHAAASGERLPPDTTSAPAHKPIGRMANGASVFGNGNAE